VLGLMMIINIILFLSGCVIGCILSAIKFSRKEKKNRIQAQLNQEAMLRLIVMREQNRRVGSPFLEDPEEIMKKPVLRNFDSHGSSDDK
jgi:hypothetical protein